MNENRQLAQALAVMLGILGVGVAADAIRKRAPQVDAHGQIRDPETGEYVCHGEVRTIVDRHGNLRECRYHHRLGWFDIATHQIVRRS